MDLENHSAPFHGVLEAFPCLSFLFGGHRRFISQPENLIQTGSVNGATLQVLDGSPLLGALLAFSRTHTIVRYVHHGMTQVCVCSHNKKGCVGFELSDFWNPF